MKFIIKNLEQLNIFAEKLSNHIEEGDVFSLIGDLGAGKTTLVQLIGKHMGVDTYITSPTFSIVNIYQGDFEINHLDLYRLDDPSELEAIDFETYFYPEGVTFIEWAEKGGDYIPDEIIEIKINQLEDTREIEFIGSTDRAIELEKRLNESFGD